MDIKIIFEDKDILVVEKPPKIPCQGDKTSDDDLMSILDRPYLGLVHRLDRPVGGVMVYAKTEKANSFLSKEISARNLYKEYLVVVCGKPLETQGELRNHLKKLRTINMSKVVDDKTHGSKEAILQYSVLDTIDTEEYGALTLLKIILKTGRHHQIRVQLSHAGFPIWGDNKYNKTFVKKKEWTQISLWAYKIGFKHPNAKEYMSFTSLPYKEFPWNKFHINN
ncbi:RNA pseudouridine synthase [Tissierella pigra]|uniref:RNA pseudouridylate synthase n=1 Tax=Tissierella pigra TaxID=2607614 RepID=A0A6N7XZU7_9FIRM|nr:RNA pseudouridine synthase [Tissierella pigra]MBU5428139.1 RNA pseudouridine synthase [Tissierella pigra]MSU01995.1 RNA pseudouridine synthase [Tissierella pigra]